MGGLHQDAFAYGATLPVLSPEHAILACLAFDLELDGLSGEPGAVQRGARPNSGEVVIKPALRTVPRPRPRSRRRASQRAVQRVPLGSARNASSALITCNLAWRNRASPVLPGSPGLRAGDPAARRASYLTRLVAVADAWLPAVQRLRTDGRAWYDVVPYLNARRVGS
jgi:hypothetical protein